MDEAKKKNSRGGARPNAGRKPKAEKDKRRTITIRLNPDVYDFLLTLGRGKASRYIEEAIRERIAREV